LTFDQRALELLTLSAIVEDQNSTYRWRSVKISERWQNLSFSSLHFPNDKNIATLVLCGMETATKY